LYRKRTVCNKLKTTQISNEIFAHKVNVSVYIQALKVQLIYLANQTGALTEIIINNVPLFNY